MYIDNNDNNIVRKASSITEEEKVRIQVLQEFLLRRKNRNDISSWERSAYEDTLNFIDKIWGK